MKVRRAGLLRWWRSALAVYWVTLFVATHVPIPRGLQPRISDKLLHLVAYFGLTLLLLLAWRPERRGIAVIVVVVAAYGATDELLQLAVGRDGDVLDWLADCAGAATAVLSYWVGDRLLRRPRHQKDRST